MSHYKPYPAYRDSGVEWIGRVPKHWARAAIKHILSEPITDGPHETPVFLNEGVEFLSVDGIQDGELVFEGKRFISYEGFSEQPTISTWAVIKKMKNRRFSTVDREIPRFFPAFPVSRAHLAQQG